MLVTSVTLAVLAVTWVPLFARGRQPSRTPLRAVLVATLYLFTAPSVFAALYRFTAPYVFTAPFSFTASLTAAPLLHASVLGLAAVAGVLVRARFEVDFEPAEGRA